MSRYTRSKKNRKRSNYPARLRARGLSKAPTMEDVFVLRARARREGRP